MTTPKSRKPMQILLSHAQWTELRMNEHAEFVRAAFFLGLPYTYIRTRIRDGYEEDRSSAIESAQEFGMNELDQVYQVKRN